MDIQLPTDLDDKLNYLDQLLDESEAGDFLGLSKNTLRQWRVRGVGPTFIQLSMRAIRYRRGDLIDWYDSRKATSTSELGS